jgi:hypothetical protein
LTVGCQAAAGNNAVQVRVELERLAPGVEQGDKTDLGPEITGLGGDGAKRRGCTGLVVTPVPKVPFWKLSNFNESQPTFSTTY